jgi:uncharacterized membrane protein
MPPKSPHKPASFATVWDQVTKTGTFVTMIIGVVMIPIEIGRRDQILTQQQKSVDELHSVVTDLVKTTINLTGTDRVHDRDLADLRARMEKLEGKRG